MTDQRAPLPPTASDAQADALRETRHGVLRELLGAYVDRELPLETLAQMDAHLVGCAQCRRELELHEAIRGRLAAERPAAPSPALRARLSAALDAAVPARPPAAVGDTAAFSRPRGALAGLAITGWLVAIALAVAAERNVPARGLDAAAVRPLTTPVHAIPLFDGMLENYARVAAADLPGRARDLSAVRAAVDFPVEPLHGAAVRLLGAWTTEVDGEPVAVLAYRLGDRLVVQYLVAEDVFFRHPAIRAALESRRLLAADDGRRALVAWPGPATGSVLVGSMPSRELAGVWAAESAR
jgi:anti-sigma factor RsiW